MRYTIAMTMTRDIIENLVDKIHKTKYIVWDIYKLNISDITYEVDHADRMCADSANFLLGKNSLTGMDMVVLDHVLDAIRDTCHEISKCEKIPEELRVELKASLRMIREVFSMDRSS